MRGLQVIEVIQYNFTSSNMGDKREGVHLTLPRLQFPLYSVTLFTLSSQSIQITYKRHSLVFRFFFFPLGKNLHYIN